MTHATARAILANAPKQASVALQDVTLLAPHRPATILCSGSNYRDHNAEKANSPISGKQPEFFVRTADCVFEVFDRAADPLAELGKPIGAEDDNHDDQDDKQFW